jgi:hypothetical protein
MDRALAQAEIRDVLRIDKAAEKDWRAAAFRLSRRFPKRWGKQREEANSTAAFSSAMARALSTFIESPPVPEPNPGSGTLPPASEDSS